MNINESLKILKKQILPTKKTVKLDLNSCLNKVISCDVKARLDLPSYDNSALDGYAFDYKYIDYPLEIKGVIFAGDKNHYSIKGKECYRIMTGAMMPNGANTIIRLECSLIKNDKLIVAKDTRENDGHRIKGEEIKKGEVIIKQGEILTSSKIMLLASQGIFEIEVYEDLKIAIFSSGNELIEPFNEAKDTQIYNANAYGIMGILKANNFSYDYKGIIKDDFDETFNILSKAQDYDVIITSGGASAGDADFMQKILEKLGYESIYSHLDIKPGRPTKCFKKDDKFIFALPGNPMPAYLICFLAIIPILKQKSGYKDIEYQRFNAKFSGELKLKSKISNIIVGKYENGIFSLINNNKFGSGVIYPVSLANAIYISQIGKEKLVNDEEIEIIRLF